MKNGMSIFIFSLYLYSHWPTSVVYYCINILLPHDDVDDGDYLCMQPERRLFPSDKISRYRQSVPTSCKCSLEFLRVQRQASDCGCPFCLSATCKSENWRHRPEENEYFLFKNHTTFTAAMNFSSPPKKAFHSLTMGTRCSKASPVSEPTARLMQNWIQFWNTLVQEVHSSTTMPNMDVRVINTLAMVA